MANFDNRHGWIQDNVFSGYIIDTTSGVPTDRTSEIVDIQSAVTVTFKLAAVRFKLKNILTINSVAFQHSDDTTPGNFVDIPDEQLIGDVEDFTNQVVDWIEFEFHPYNKTMGAFNTKRYVRMVVNYTSDDLGPNQEPKSILIGFIKNETQIGTA